MDNILDNIRLIYERKNIINNIIKPLIKKISKKDAHMGENVRKFVINETNLVESDEKLFEIKADGNCLFRALAKIIYNNDDDDTTHRVRREIVKYMLKITFENDWYKDHVKIYDGFLIQKTIKNVDEINYLHKERWENYIFSFQEDNDFYFITNYKSNSEKILGIICTFMEGLP